MWTIATAISLNHISLLPVVIDHTSSRKSKDEGEHNANFEIKPHMETPYQTKGQQEDEEFQYRIENANEFPSRELGVQVSMKRVGAKPMTYLSRAVANGLKKPLWITASRHTN